MPDSGMNLTVRPVTRLAGLELDAWLELEDDDGGVTEVLQVTVEDWTENWPWFSTGTRRTVTKRTKKIP
jgi:hypothetical protein